MDEWGVFLVIVSVVTFVGTVVKAVVPLTRTNAELIVTLKHLQNSLEEQKDRAHESHKRLWDEAERQDDVLRDHEGRICKLEGHHHEH